MERVGHADGSSRRFYDWNGVDDVPEGVTRVRVDTSVKEIREDAFSGRRNLEEVELPEGLIIIGRGAFSGCRALLAIRVPSTVREIGWDAFRGCWKLEVAILPDGLQTLTEYVFDECRALKRIAIPASVKKIEDSAFSTCESLVEVTFLEGLIAIESYALFYECTSLACISLPSSLRVIDMNALHKNDALVSIELSERVEMIDDYGTQLNSLRNIALPRGCRSIGYSFSGCRSLKEVLQYDESSDNSEYYIADALMRRFDDLPVHKACYFRSHEDGSAVMRNLRREINPWSSRFPGQLNLTGRQRDCLGMTPVHILACSTTHDVEMYQLLVGKYPETLIMKDKWGDTPLLYAAWCNVPEEILQFLAESYKTYHPGYELDWAGMITTLCRARVPVGSVQNLVNLHRNSFPCHQFDMQSIVAQLAKSDTSNSHDFNQQFILTEVLQYLVHASVSGRLDSLNVGRWRSDIEDDINNFPEIMNNVAERLKVRDELTARVYSKLALFELAKEAGTILELALWKVRIGEHGNGHRNKRARVDHGVDYRAECRINCGAGIVVRNVLPYLLPSSHVNERHE